MMPPSELDDWKNAPRQRLSADNLGSDPVSKRISYALANGLCVEITYGAPKRVTVRTVWPKYIELVPEFGGGAVYMRARCELRGEDRTFRLDRVREARVPDGPANLRKMAAAAGKTGKLSGLAPKRPTTRASAQSQAASSSSRSRPHSTPEHRGRAPVASWERPASSGTAGRPQEPVATKREQPSAASPRSATSASSGCPLPAISTVLLVMAIGIGSCSASSGRRHRPGVRRVPHPAGERIRLWHDFSPAPAL